MGKELTVSIKGFDCSIDVTLKGENIYFHHIITGQLQENLDQCFVGWSEQEKSEKIKWFLLKESIKELLYEECLIDYIIDFEEEGEFSLKDLNYNLIKSMTIFNFINLCKNNFIDTDVCIDNIKENQLKEEVFLNFSENTVYECNSRIKGTTNIKGTFKILNIFDF